uniref:Right handed beta helix domain-containing protein n=1 Tax=uncultured bacterium lac193 TaxID=1447243 RepID=X2L8F3_9BACT|nr:hypothetical protein [uncultured bacterium lac193]
MPAPSFGITQAPGTANYFVDNTHSAATDTDNVSGTATRPRRTVPTSLPAGAVVEIRGGPYLLSSQVTWTGGGSAAAPVFIRGIGSPVMTTTGTTGEIVVAGQYFVIDGITFDKLIVQMASGLHHFALRRSTVRNYSPSSNSSAVNVQGTDIVVYANEVHNNGDPTGAVEIDIHGVKLGVGDERVWVVDNHIHHNGGDAIQVGSATSAEPWARFVYIGRNTMHHDRENAVDIKQSRDVIITENDMYGYSPRASSSGEAVIVHNNPDRVWVINNRAHDSARGIVSTGAIGFYVIGNLVTNIHEAGFSTTSLSDGHGIMARATTQIVAVNNTLWSVDGGFSQDGNAPADCVNNIIGAVSAGGHHLGWGSTTSGSASLIRNNLLQGTVNILWAGSRYTSLSSFETSTGKGQGSVNASPQFVSSTDWRLLAGSPAIDAGYATSIGTPHPVFALFEATYPGAGAITRDISGRLRSVLGAQWELGAYDQNSSSTTVPAPLTPSNLRIIR